MIDGNSQATTPSPMNKCARATTAESHEALKAILDELRARLSWRRLLRRILGP